MKWLPWILLVVGLLLIAFAKRLGRDSVRQRMETRFMPPEAQFIPARKKLEEESYRWMFGGVGVLFVLASLLLLARAYLR